MNKYNIDSAKVKAAGAVTHALSHRERLMILRLLERRGNLRPRDFMRETGLSGNRVNLHLKTLTGCGLVKKRKESKKEIYYVLQEDRLAQALKAIALLVIRKPAEYREMVKVLALVA